MLKHRSIVVAFVASLIAITTHPAHSQPTDETPAHSTELWQGLAEGMSPETALTNAQAIDGVKRAKVVNRRKPDKPNRLSITHQRGDIQIAALPFKLDLQFSDARLVQVWLVSSNQCGEDAERIFESLSAGIAAKHPQIIYQAPMRRSDVLRAYSRSLASGEKRTITHIFANDNVALLLTFALSRKAPPPNPGYGNRLARSLYAYALSEFRGQLSECGGTGDRRVHVALQYISRAAFDAKAQETAEKLEVDQDALIDQL